MSKQPNRLTVTMTVTIDVDADAYAEAYALTPAEVAKEVREHVGNAAHEALSDIRPEWYIGHTLHATKVETFGYGKD